MQSHEPHSFKPGKPPYAKSCDICGRVKDWMVHRGMTMMEATLYQQGGSMAEILRKRNLPALEQRSRALDSRS